MKRPSFQFYPADWQANSNLRRCSFEEKGIWLEVICLLHDQDQYGVSNWSLRDIAQAVATTPAKIKGLVDKGVLKGADKDQVVPALVYIPRSGRKLGAAVTLIPEQPGPLWYSSRMVEDEYKRVLRGDLGGTPKATPDPSPKVAPKPTLGAGIDAPKSAPDPSPDPSPFSCAQASRAAPSSSSSSSSSTTSKSKASANASRLPADWLPTDGDAEYCKTKRPDLVLVEVAERFRDYWLGSGGKKVDWNATWRNWVQNERRGAAQGPPQATLADQNARNNAEAMRLLEGKAPMFDFDEARTIDG